MLPEAVHRYGGWVAFAAGLSLPFAFSPFHLWPIAPLAVALLIALWDEVNPRRAAWLGFVFGFGLFLYGTHWLYVSLHIYGEAPVALAIPLMGALMALMAAYTAALGYLVVRFGPAPGAWRWLAAVPAGWTLVEWLRGWVLSGFPWLSLGYTASDNALAGWIPVGGVYLATFATVLTAGALRAVFTGPAGRVVAVGVLAAVWIGALALRAVSWTTPHDDELQVSIVQGAISQDRKWLPEELVPTMQLYRDLSARNWASDIIVWPEAAIPALRSSLDSYLEAVHQQARETDTAVVLGIIEFEPRTRQFYNGIIAMDETVTTYHKRHLVPFGEYFPVPGFVREWLRLRNLPYSDYTRGAADQPPLPAGGELLGASICYEDAFGDELRGVLPEATLLVNVSNDAWFGESIAPHQHLQIARVRALEAGRTMLRATNTGISAVIGADGRVQGTIPQFETAVLTERVRPRSGATPYARAGDVAVVVLAVALLLGGLWRGRRGYVSFVPSP